jgi:FixJ family two-component response regulator
MYRSSTGYVQRAVAIGDVFVVDDDDDARRALTKSLAASGFVVRAFNSAETFLKHRPTKAPVCVVLDYHLPGLSVLGLQKNLLDDCAASVVFVTRRGDVSTVVQAMKGGAVDFLTKPVDPEQLLAAVTRGLEQSARADAERRLYGVFLERVDRLTRREREVATGLIRGLLNKQIAAELGTTERTVKVHRAHVMAKLQVGSVAELVQLVEHAKRGDGVMAIGSAARSEADRLLDSRRH